VGTRNVVVVGGGFAGVQAAVGLAHDERFDVTLISENGHFRYLPALYKAAKGGHRAGSSLRLADIFDGTRVALAHAKATRIDRPRRLLVVNDGRAFAYDYLVLALGSVVDYFGNDAFREATFTIKTNDETTEFKRHLHDRLVARPERLDLTIVGGGSIGVEMAGALPGYIGDIAAKHQLGDVPLRLTVVEPAPRLMHKRAAALSRTIARRLRRLGVALRLGQPIEGNTRDTLRVGDLSLRGHTVVWTAGVVNPPFFTDNGFPLTEKGKTDVNVFLESEPGIYVIGDNADTHLSGLAQTALHHGAYVAEDLKRQAQGRPRVPYDPIRPKLPTTLIPVGPGWVAVQWGRFTISGWAGAALRFLADLATFKDVESWPKAGERWIEIEDDQGECPTCQVGDGTRTSH
jgi:NADH dehydrogenase